MTDLISRRAAIDALGDAHFKNYGNAIMVIQDLPSAEPVRHGKWIFESIRGHAVMTCSECCKVQDGQTLCFTYCPNCGARMDEE